MSYTPPVRRDVALAILVGICAAAVAWTASRAVPPTVYQRGSDVWFEGDMDRVFSNMVDRQSDHYRVKVHPLFSIVAYGMTWIPRCRLHLDPLLSVRVVIAAVAFAWGALLYALLRVVAESSIGALLFALIGVASSSLLFWTAVPETYIFGSASIVLAMLLAALPSRAREGSLTLASAATLSFTITNWMAGIAVALATLPKRRAVQVTINAFAIVVLLWGVQKYLFPSATFFIGDREEKDYVFKPAPSRVVDVANGFVVTPMVMPQPLPAFREDHREQLLFTQPARPSSSPLPIAAVGSWLALLLLGGAAMLRAPAELRPLRLALLLTLAGQFALHLVYGNETFLYSLHFFPLLLVVAAFALRTRVRRAALVLAVVLIVTAAVNNLQRFRDACAFVAHPPLHEVAAPQ